MFSLRKLASSRRRLSSPSTAEKNGRRQLFVEQLEDRRMLAVFNVTTISDVVDGGDGVLSLREAVIAANANTGSDQVNLPAGIYTLSIDGTGEDLAATGDLDVTDTSGTLTIIGAGASATLIEAAGLATPDRVIDVLAGASVSLDSVMLTNGDAGSDDGGGLRNRGTTVLTRSAVIGNAARNGAGIDTVNGVLTLYRTDVSNNNATELGGGIHTAGSGLPVPLISIDASTISNNTAVFSGGGIIHLEGDMTVSNSTVSGNVSGSSGGGIINDDSMIVSNSTVSGNLANGGGGIFHVQGQFDIENSTVTNNTASVGGGILNFTSPGFVTMTSTIVAGNIATSSSNDLNGPITSGGNNLLGDDSGSSGLVNGVNGDQVGTGASPLDPLLGPLQNNGGPTLTHALMAGSPGIDAGSNGAGLTQDQRRYFRVIDGDGDTTATIDIGAYEHLSCGTIVLNTNDSGLDSLREAITCSNSQPSFDTISFEIARGTQTIQPLSELPTITDPAVIDGATQPGFAGTPIVEIDGSGVPGFQPHGLHITAGNSTVRGLVINNFIGFGIKIETAGGNVIQGNYLSTDLTGTLAASNDTGGVLLNSPNNLVGTNGDGVSDAAERNVISGSDRVGIEIGSLFGSTNNVVAGNYIGTDVTGTLAVPNLGGIVLGGGGDGARIGTDSDGVADAAERNLVSGNTVEGISIRGSSNVVVAGNFVGTNATGTAALGNAVGVTMILTSSNNLVGGSAAAARNIIAANSAFGVNIETGANNLVQGNFIGTDVTGTVQIGNATGVNVANGATGSIIGTNGDGVDDATEGNLISGNATGVRVFGATTTQTRVAGNLIGTDVTGTVALGNANFSMLVSGGTSINTVGTNGDGVSDALERNVISGNGGDGLNLIGTTGNTVAGNFIGTDITGSAAVANAGQGVSITSGATGNTIGGSLAAETNVIAFNQVNGVLIASASTNRVQQNSIHSNGALGIDLGGGGVTLNDPGDGDAGANGLQNFPVITSVQGLATTTIQGTLNSTPNSAFTVELFSSTTADASGFGEGETFLTSTIVNTNASGDGSFTVNLPFSLPYATPISATATDSSGSTSEFSQVEQLNNAPTANDDGGVSFTTDEDTAFTTGNVLANDTDPDVGDSLSVLSFNMVGTTGLVIDNGNGTFDYDPNGQFESLAVGATASDTFTYTISDGNGDTDTATVTITINGVNDAPVADAGGPYTVFEGNTLNLDASGTTDPDTPSLTYRWDVDGDGDFDENITGEQPSVPWATLVSLGIDDGPDGPRTLTVEADDGTVAVTNSTTLTVNNTPPTIGLSGLAFPLEGSQYDLTLQAVTDPGDDTVTAIDIEWDDGTSDVGLPPSVAPGIVSHTYDDNDPNILIFVRATDEDSAPNPHILSGALSIVVVNVAPTAVLSNNGPVSNGSTADVSFSSQSDPSNADTTAGFHYAYDYDNDGSFESGDGTYAGSGTSDSATVPVSFLAAGPGTYTVRARIIDKDDGFTDYTTNVVVNSPPVADAGGPYTVFEGNTLNLDASGTTDSDSPILTYRWDVDGDGDFDENITGEQPSVPWATLVSLGIDDGPDGPRTVTVEVDDGTDAVTDSTTLTVNNTPPSLMLSWLNLTDEGSQFTLNLQGVNDPGEDTVTLFTVDWGDGDIDTFTSGPFTHVYEDGPLTPTITVGATDEDGVHPFAGFAFPTIVNVDPTANADTPSVSEDGPGVTFDVLANDTDPAGILDPLTLTGFDATGVVGSLTDNGGGSFTYDPNGLFEALAAGETATEVFTYTIDDGDGGTDTGTVTVTVNGVNDAPTANDDSGAAFTTDEDTAFTTVNVLTNDTDPDANDTLTVASISTVGTLGLVVDNGNGTFSYDPNGQFESLDNGQMATDTFTYSITDGNGGSDTATVTITINGISDDPADEIQDVIDDIQDIIDGTPGDQKKLEDAIKKLDDALDELNEMPPDNDKAVKKLKDAVKKIEDAVDKGEIDPVVADQLMDALAGIGRSIAVAAIDLAITLGGDPGDIADAQAHLADGDTERAIPDYEEALKEYEKAIKDAENALPLVGLSQGDQSGVPALSHNVLDPIVQQAIGLWSAAGVDPARVAALRSIDVHILELPRQYLGFGSPDAIWIDADAAGYGWHDSLDMPGSGRMDLLSVVSHELGHALGLHHDDHGGVMGAALSAGTRLLPEAGNAAHRGRSPAVVLPRVIQSLSISNDLVDQRRSRQNDQDEQSLLAVFALWDTQPMVSRSGEAWRSLPIAKGRDKSAADHDEFFAQMDKHDAETELTDLGIDE